MEKLGGRSATGIQTGLVLDEPDWRRGLMGTNHYRQHSEYIPPPFSLISGGDPHRTARHHSYSLRNGVWSGVGTGMPLTRLSRERKSRGGADIELGRGAGLRARYRKHGQGREGG